ncbi:MAG: cation transporter [Candidatus Cryosericum sp.]|nr:cation transporter [bacterium]
MRHRKDQRISTAITTPGSTLGLDIMQEIRRASRGLAFALVGYIAIFAVQLTSYFVTHMLALLAQAFATLSNALVATVVLLALLWSQKPVNMYLRWSRGSKRNVIALISVTFIILFLAAGTLWRALAVLIRGGAFRAVNPALAITVLSIGMLLVSLPVIDVVHSAREGSSIRLRLLSLLKDEVCYAGAIVGVALAAAGHSWADPAASLLIAGSMAAGGALLVRDCILLLRKHPAQPSPAG